MSEFTHDATSGYHDHILMSVVERTSILVEAQLAADSRAFFSFEVLAQLMVAAEIRELGLEVREAAKALEALVDVVSTK